MRIKVVSFFIFSKSFQKKKKIKALRPKMTKIASRGSCLKVARNEVKNASFAQRSAHRDSRIWRPELIEPAAERKRRARADDD